jgi:drug/metabolite transporter (DMT)-like permease
MLDAAQVQLTPSRGDRRELWRRIGATLVSVGGVILMVGGVTPLGTLTSSEWCAVHAVVCYGDYSPSWLGLGNDPPAPQLGDWATYQGTLSL